MRFGDFCNVKDQYDFISTLAFLASRRACRPTAVFPSQLTRSCTTPASREARRRAAVTPQPSRMSPYAPVRLRRAVRKGLSPRAAVTPQSICFPSSSPMGAVRGAGGHPLPRSPGSRGTTPCEWREWWNVGRGLKKTIQKQESGRKMLAWGGGRGYNKPILSESLPPGQVRRIGSLEGGKDNEETGHYGSCNDDGSMLRPARDR